MATFGFDEAKNKKEVYTKEEVISILQQAIDSGSTQGVDASLVPTPAKVKEIKENANVAFWVGSESEFEALGASVGYFIGRVDQNNNVYIITDDTALNSIETELQAAAERDAEYLNVLNSTAKLFIDDDHSVPTNNYSDYEGAKVGDIIECGTYFYYVRMIATARNYIEAVRLAWDSELKNEILERQDADDEIKAIKANAFEVSTMDDGNGNIRTDIGLNDGVKVGDICTDTTTNKNYMCISITENNNIITASNWAEIPKGAYTSKSYERTSLPANIEDFEEGLKVGDFIFLPNNYKAYYIYKINGTGLYAYQLIDENELTKRGYVKSTIVAYTAVTSTYKLKSNEKNEVRYSKILTALTLEVQNYTVATLVETKIVFKSGSVATIFNCVRASGTSTSAPLPYFEGDDTNNGVFTPQSGKLYEVNISWNGLRYNATVKSWDL